MMDSLNSRIAVGLAAIVLLQGAPNVATADEPYPLEYFALRAVVSNVTVSPDAEHVAMLKILSREGDPILHIYKSDDMEGDPFVVNSDPMEIMSYYWASDQHIVLTLRQQTREKVKRQEGTVYDYKIAILDIEKEEFEEFDAASPAVENLLVGKPDKIIVSEQPGLEDGPSLEKAFRPRAYYEMDLKRGTKSLLLRGKWSMGQVEFDAKGNPRLGRGYDASTNEYVYYYREPGKREWHDIWRWSDDEFRVQFEDVLGFDDAVPGNLIVRAYRGDDKLGLWSFNPKTKSFDELLYRRSDVDVYNVRTHSNSWSNPDQIVGVSYFKDNFHFEYFDEIEGATYNQLKELIPYAHYVTIPSRSRDGNTLIARNLGPRDPGTYYLLHNGEFKVVGSRQPLLDPEELADQKYITYEARDGRKMAAFVTMPKGDPPYPTIVQDNGGPHGHKIRLYDKWTQMLTNQGYMVVFPIYRMAWGYGFDHYASAFMNGSEAGRRMQDDHEDAALHLVEEGLADPDRMAFFGWSYGGYASLIAAARTPQIFQCSIAGAAVTDYAMAGRDEFRGRRNLTGTSKFWRDVFQFGAVQPVEQTDQVNIPILLVHGSVDARVLPKHAKVYREALDKSGKEYKYVELEGADHSSALFYRHEIELFTEMIDFLQNNCGSMSLPMQANVAEGE